MNLELNHILEILSHYQSYIWQKTSAEFERMKAEKTIPSNIDSSIH